MEASTSVPYEDISRGQWSFHSRPRYDSVPAVDQDVCATPIAFPPSITPDQMYDFDDRIASKISITEDVMNPIFEKDPFLELAMCDMAHPTLSDTISTLSEASDFPLMLPPTVSNGKLMDEGMNTAPVPELLPSPTSLSFGVYESYSHNLGSRMGSQAVGENLVRHNFTTINPLSGDFTTDSFSLMSNPEHDLYGFLSQAVPLTQMATAVAKTNAQAPMQTLSSMPCILPMQDNPIPQTPPPQTDIPMDLFQDSFRQIYSTAMPTQGADPLVSVVKPVISKEAVVQTGLATVSLAVSRGSPSATAHAPASKRSAASMAELSAARNKHNSSSRLYECPICHKMFERAYNRKMHITTHEAIENRLKPFVCPIETCGKRFARKHDKNRHYMGVHLRTRKAGNARGDTPTSIDGSQNDWGGSSPLPAMHPATWTA